MGCQVLGFVDDDVNVGRSLRWPLFDLMDERVADAKMIVGVGHNLARRRITEDLLAAGRVLINIVHPDACVSESAGLGRGVYIGARAVVNSGAYLGDSVIVNSGAVVEHDCKIGAYAHVCPGAVLGGDVVVGKCATLGLGARVIPGKAIGDYVTVGAGGVVINDVRESATVVGVPAKEL